MPLNVITCNIRFNNPTDGPNAWPHRRDFLCKTLINHDPDIIATQEGRHDQLKELEVLLKEYLLIDLHREWINERMYPSFFIKKNKFDIITSGDIWLSDTPNIPGSSSFDSTFPRLLTYLKVKVIGTEKKIFFVNTHFDHVKEETRISQARVLIDEIQKLLSVHSHLIIMGDFNDGPQSKVRQKIQNAFPMLKDAWSIFHKIEETSHHAFKGEMQNGSRIDWLMIDEKLHIESAQMDKSHNQGRYPTDHFPVVAKISL